MQHFLDRGAMIPKIAQYSGGQVKVVGQERDFRAPVDLDAHGMEPKGFAKTLELFH